MNTCLTHENKLAIVSILLAWLVHAVMLVRSLLYRIKIKELRACLLTIAHNSFLSTILTVSKAILCIVCIADSSHYINYMNCFYSC